jgi:TolB-like protein/tetratricopeptide (TPR) repeat protein
MVPSSFPAAAMAGRLAPRAAWRNRRGPCATAVLVSAADPCDAVGRTSSFSTTIHARLVSHLPEDDVGIAKLFHELRRRHVLRVMGGYAFVAWLVVEAYTTIQPILWEGYEWTNRIVVIGAFASFPIVFILAWVFDITPQGVRRTAPLAPAQSANAGGAGPACAPAMAYGSGAQPRTRLSARAAGFFGLGVLVALVGFAAYAGYHHELPARAGTAAAAPIESIAVLPFADMSPGRDQEFFSDGLTEELLNHLARVPELRVAARTSSFAFRSYDGDVRDIGRRLGVQAVLEGSVRRDGDRLRVSAKLVDTGTGYQIWSDSFDGGATDVFGLQEDIAHAVVAALRQRFTVAPEAGRRGTTSARAYELYLLGLKRWHVRTPRDLRQALEHFQDAVHEDPAFALAWAGLAQTYAVLPVYGAFPVDTAVLRGSAAAAQAIALDPSLADAYAAMGQIVQNFEWDLRGAESYYRRALNYQPGHTTAHQWYAETLMLLGRHNDAAAHVAHVLAADPLAPTAFYIDAYLKMLRGRVADGLATWRELTRLHPDFALGVLHHGLAAAALGEAAEAAAALGRLAELLPEHAEVYAALAAALRRPAALQAARTALARAGLAPSERAAWHLVLGQPAAALAAFEDGFGQHSDVNLPFLLVHPLVRPLHGEPRFQDMLRAIELHAAA